MIADKIVNLQRYTHVPGVQTVIDYLNSTDLSLVENGKYELSEDVIVKVMEYVTHEEPDEVLLEAHREYLDLQYVHSGNEQFLFQAIELGDEAVPYDKKKDVEFFTAQYYSSIALTSGDFVIVFPNDLHVGNVNADGEESVKKFVFKLKIWNERSCKAKTK